MAIVFPDFPQCDTFACVEDAILNPPDTDPTPIPPPDPEPIIIFPPPPPEDFEPDPIAVLPPLPPPPEPIPVPTPGPEPVAPIESDPFFGLLPDLPDIEDLIDAFQEGILAALVGVVDNIDGIIDGAVDKILNPITALKGALDVVTSAFTSGIATAIGIIRNQADRVITQVSDKIGDAFQGVIGVIESVIAQMTQTIGAVLGAIEATIASTIDIIAETIGGALAAVISITEQIIVLVGEKITAAIESSAAVIEASIGVPFAKLADILPFQIATLGETIAEGFGTFLDIPDLLGEKVKEVFTDLGNLFGLDSLVALSKMVGQFTAESGFNPSISEVIANADPDNSADMEINAKSSALLAAIPIVGTFFQTLHPAVYEKIQQRSFELDRPTLLGVPDGLELLRRFPDEADGVISDLQKQGWPNERIEQLTRLRFQLTPVADTLDAWRRNFIDDQGLADKLDSLGWSDSDQALLRKLTFRIPPIQDMILFAIRGVFDVEESRAFGEFEGLPPELERAFIEAFDIEGGDFSRQVEVFATEAQKLGLSPEWVAAYWTSHWRLPSLQTAYEMFHRLQPDILAAESDRVAADGFTTSELEFTRPELDRLVRAQDFSSFWRPKLSAIAFNPLTRVDIRRIAKLLGKDKEWMIIQYRKVGFSPFDANLMADFTIAFNAEPDQDQAVEVRNLTKTVILDFVETSILTPEEGVERLELIGYDSFAAEALVDLELAKVERGLQRDQIDLIEEQVRLQILDLNSASIELDAIGVPASQKEVIIRRLGIQLAPRPSSPSKSDLDNFLNQRVIEVGDYRIGLAERGFSEDAIDLYVKLDRRLPTRKELTAFFIGDTIQLSDFENGLMDLGYSASIIALFSGGAVQEKADALEEQG